MQGQFEQHPLGTRAQGGGRPVHPNPAREANSECAKIITSSIAVSPKKTVGKWQVIVDMSRPRGASVNGNFRRGLTHIAFSPVEDAAHLMHYLGPSTLLAKMDVSEAYRLVPVHPEDRIWASSGKMPSM